MAAGRHGGYRDNEFRDREADFEVSRREYAYSKEEYDYERIRSSKHENNDRGRVRYMSDRVRQKDIKEREVITNGGYRSSSSRSDSGSSGGGRNSRGPKPKEFSVKAIDREPGELSSESGSEDATEIESISKGKDSEVSKVVENGIQSPLERKRKFSPIVWDRDDNNVGKSRNSPVVTALPPPPPLPKTYRKSPNVVPEGGVHVSPPKSRKNQNLQSVSPINPPVVSRSVEYSTSESPVGLSSSPSKEQQWDNVQEFEHLDDEDYVPTRNISSSRWAAGNSSPVDEGEILEDEEVPKRRKKMPLSESLQTRLRNKSISPELVELKRTGSERARSRSSESDEQGSRARSLSGDGYHGNDSEKDDYMEIDEERNHADISVSGSDANSDDETDSRETPEPAAPPQRSINMLQGCRSVDEFERLNKIDEGTYGVVYRAKDKKTGEIVALKKVKMEKEREGFPLTSLREINILLSFHHPSIVDVKEVVVGSNLDSIFMVMEYMEHDLKGLMEAMKQPFSQSEVKCLMLQLLEGVKYLHDNWVLHRDLKTSNLLLNNRGELKICDFGLARQYGSPLKPYTHLVVTLWYRAPELLLGGKQYSTAIDMWSLGCIMAEMLSKEPLFNGKTEFDQLDKIFRILGTPNETIWPGFSKLPGVKVNFVKHQYNLLRKKFPATSFTGSPVLSDAGFDLLNKLLTYDPEKRITADAALNHDWFREVPLPKSKDFMPTFPAQHAQDRRMRRVMKSPDPLEEQRRKELQQGELGTGGLFG
ncbi:cyclin-dependent kinase G-2 isoform X1 [Pistacia vera]|uniref:cyclin-dependent kinase G-2 isoform X1 n=1 Tax=Pistacia vera TaxID=55513 RepID=UPI001262FAC2|nr:cyclin-dependent kinase G-2 isoform X1 [Pistacia vera]XP_031268027.1 cyclin-dependent kinase G-2 isoform X1 [Pistacia vera]XP_031268028.1 cyclin-dependent kinase G-2 isoform X1 [Pistacia vera]XP_031268030.1 cyclin-dependent kinase G-2 isoform X1 [Pistacia vera]XP_031268031.1 cyclin-dependent kinase G-2 isoform X1 [Pistacia vera]